jgi:cell division protein FtsI (penicillin-binding protein 3)
MLVDTEHGVMHLGKHTIKDVHDYGLLTLPEVMVKSSNVGMVKLSQKVGGKVLLDTYKKFKFFEPTYAGILGEQLTISALQIKPNSHPYHVLSYGYGMQLSTLQLAQAYVILGNRGSDPGLHVVSSQQLSRLPARQVAPSKVVDRVVDMMVRTVDEGTGREARIDKIKVAGKTGTTRIISGGKYDKNKHIASFVGFAPADATSPADIYTIAVVMFEPKHELHYGAQAAAPLFKNVMQYALSLKKHIDIHTN